MDEIQIYASATVAILGIAYPILLQVISRLDEKYDSDYIVELFEGEWIRKLFIFSLFSSLFSIFLWTLKRPPLILRDYLIVQNSAAIMVIFTTILLIIVFFGFVNKVIEYYTPQKIVRYFIKKHNRWLKNEQPLEDLKYFKALSSIFLISIRRHQTNISKTLSDFFYGEFRKVREKSKNQLVEYPQQFYDLVYTSIEEIVLTKERRNRTLEYRLGNGVWLIGETEVQISEKTYLWLWLNLRLAVQNNHDDMVFAHWENADKYFSYYLRQKESVNKLATSSTTFIKPSNQDEVKKRESERERFIEFHYALGGLLSFSKRFYCIRRMFEYTNQIPPKYVLLPDSMNEIFQFFFKINNDINREFEWISNKYPFPNLSGLRADGIVKKWISSYMAILFLRQYTLLSLFTYSRPLDFPDLPPTQGEKKSWIEGLNFFKGLVVDLLGNSEILESLGFGFLTERWCEENDKLYPLEFLDRLKEQLEAKYEQGSLTISVDSEKEKQFFDSSKRSIETAIVSAMRINNNSPVEGEVDIRYVIGERMLQNKDPFSKNPEASHLNFDSFLSEAISRKIIDGLGSTFILKLAKTYLMPPENLFKAIDALKVNKEEFVIVNFGLRISYYRDHLNIRELTETSYKEIPIINFSGSRSVNRTLFVLKKAHLPKITPLTIDPEVEEKYLLKPISGQFNVKGSIIDLHQKADIREEFTGKEKSDEELKRSVLVSIYLSLEIKWKKEARVVEIAERSPWEEQGIAHDIKDVVIFGQIT
ncbi:hypothetical protein [Lunatimonas lonarensis]|nr:hypothetical protein [Lunatimonas lonarensis]